MNYTYMFALAMNDFHVRMTWWGCSSTRFSRWFVVVIYACTLFCRFTFSYVFSIMLPLACIDSLYCTLHMVSLTLLDTRSPFDDNSPYTTQLHHTIVPCSLSILFHLLSLYCLCCYFHLWKYMQMQTHNMYLVLLSAWQNRLFPGAVYNSFLG